jgi:hypothetical protein
MNMMVPAANNRPKKRSINLIVDIPPARTAAAATLTDCPEPVPTILADAPATRHPAAPFAGRFKSRCFMLKLRLITPQF